jgi:hypothetical protein
MLSKNTDIKLEALENVCEKLSESRIMHAMKVWGIHEVWKEIYKILRCLDLQQMAW